MIQSVIPEGRMAAIASYYGERLQVGSKAEMANCLVQIKRIGARLWLTVWPQTGSEKEPTTHFHLGRGCWLRERWVPHNHRHA